MSATISQLTLVIGEAKSEGFLIEIDGAEFHLDDFILTQSLLRPSTMSFSLRKDPKEDGSEPQFKVCTSIIGKDVELHLVTDKTEKVSLQEVLDEDDTTQEIVFKGLVASAYGSRSMSDYIIRVEASSYDAMLLDNPACKSFENKTLQEIVEDIVDDYGTLISANIDPRKGDQIPYTVQYNENNYQFLQRLAQRYGEWMFNDGEHLVFGKLETEDPLVLGYPDKDVPEYNVTMQMQHTAFSHLASSYNNYAATVKDGLQEMERDYNTLADAVYNVSCERLTKPTLQNLHSGGYADQDSRTSVLDTSTKTQARGTKANMLTYNGTTYSSKLKIGSILVIKDNFLQQDLVGNLSDVDQDEILITELVHTFDSQERYSNRFSGIPSACDYPPYYNSDVYPTASPCRAKVVDTEDPNVLGRVRVQFDWQAQLDSDMITPWLRISQPYAGGGKGVSFIPEIGEEVMIDFEGGNAERPYVSGTLFNGVDDPDGAWLPGNNQVKAIRTRNGHTIEIWDEGEGGYIKIYDNQKNNYILTFSTDQKLIRLESTGNIELYAQNDIIMHAGHDINASADNDVFISAGNDMQRTADNDIREHAGHDRTTSIDRNDSLTVASNQFVKVDDNKDEQVKNKLQITADNIRIEAKDQLLEYSKTHHQKASDTMAINAQTQIDIKASQVKTN